MPRVQQLRSQGAHCEDISTLSSLLAHYLLSSSPHCASPMRCLRSHMCICSFSSDSEVGARMSSRLLWKPSLRVTLLWVVILTQLTLPSALNLQETCFGSLRRELEHSSSELLAVNLRYILLLSYSWILFDWNRITETYHPHVYSSFFNALSNCLTRFLCTVQWYAFFYVLFALHSLLVNFCLYSLVSSKFLSSLPLITRSGS